MGQNICDLKELDDVSCKEFIVKKGGAEKDAFIIHFEQHYFAYENSCPHTGVNLNWQEGQFFSVDGLFLQCSMHGALFEPSTGLCIRGPCCGNSLKKVGITTKDGFVCVSD
jgi:nitrite reductase/ring-hydroxylating ferredoxin subunit